MHIRYSSRNWEINIYSIIHIMRDMLFMILWKEINHILSNRQSCDFVTNECFWDDDKSIILKLKTKNVLSTALPINKKSWINGRKHSSHNDSSSAPLVAISINIF